MEAMTPTLPAFGILERTPSVLRGMLAGATSKELRWRPSEDRWSIAMVLAHLADVEENGFVARFRAIAGHDSPFLPSYDQWALFRARTEFDVGEELTRFEQRRQPTLAWLRSLPDEVRPRTGRHEELGVISFDNLLNEFAFHDLGHIRQVAELYRAKAFYPRMGTFQQYYQVNP
jgi:hypothetical protein